MFNMIVHGRMFAYLVDMWRGKLVFTGNRGSPQGYLYNEMTGMWNVSIDRDLEDLVYECTIATVEKCKEYIQSLTPISSHDETKKNKYLLLLKEQKEMLRTLEYSYSIWKNLVDELFDDQFVNRLDDTTSKWCPLNDGKTVHLTSGKIRRIEPQDYFSKCVNVNSIGKTNNDRHRILFHNFMETKDEVCLREIMNDTFDIHSTCGECSNRDNAECFLDEALVRVDPLKNSAVDFKTIYSHYQTYCLENECTPKPRKSFGMFLVKVGYNKTKRFNTLVVLDVKLSDKYSQQN